MIRQGRHRRGRAHDNGLRVRVGRRGAAGTHEMSILVNDQRAQHSSMHEAWALCIVGTGLQLRDPPANIAAHHHLMRGTHKMAIVVLVRIPRT